MPRLTALVSLVVLVTSCSRQPPPPSLDTGAASSERGVARVIVMKVEGMQRGEGGKT